MEVLENYLQNVANAIRNKTGGTAKIEAMDFASEILSIPQTTTSKLQEKTVTHTTTSALTVNPDSGYDGMSKVTVNPKLQSKTTTITSNTTTNITPDSGYSGLSQVSVTTNVSGGKLGGTFTWNHYNTSAINNSQTYNISVPANKQYAIIVFVIAAQSNTPRGTLEVTSKPSNITLSAIGSVNGGRETNSVQTTTYCYLATKTSSISSAATITFKNDWSDTGNGYGNAGCTYGVFYNV